jgi:hypothetical protein
VFLLALSSWHLYWSQNARFYTTLMLLYIVAQFVFLFYLESNRTSTLFFVFILVALSIREKATALVLIPVLIADLIVFNILQVGESRKFPWKVLAVGGTLIILLGGYLIFRDLSKLAAKFFAFSSNPLRLSLSIVYEIGIPLFVVAATAGVFYLQKKNCRGLLLLLGAIIPPILLFMISPFALTNSRHVFVILPNWVILGALGVKEVYANIRGHARIFAVGLFLLLVIFSVSQDYLYFAYQNGNRPDWKGSYELVMKQKSAEDIVVSTRPGVGTYYLGERVLWNQNFDIVRINDFNGKVWFVLDYSISYIPPELQEFLDNKTRLVDVRDTFLPGKSMQVRVYVYEPGT